MNSFDFSKQDKIRLNSAGFSLVQMIMAMGILSVVMLGMMTYMSSLHKSLNYLTMKHQVLNFSRQLESALISADMCTCMFKDIGIHIGSVENLNQLSFGCLSGDLLAAVGQPLEKGDPTGLRVSSINLENVKSVASNLYSAQMKISFEGERTIAAKPITKDLLVKVAGGKIDSCGQVTQSKLEICDFLKGAYNKTTDTCDLPQQAVVINNNSPPPGNNQNTPISFSTSQSQAGYTFMFSGPPNSPVSFSCNAATCPPGWNTFGALDANGFMTTHANDSCSSYGLAPPCAVTYDYRAENNGTTKSITLKWNK